MLYFACAGKVSQFKSTPYVFDGVACILQKSESNTKSDPNQSAKNEADVPTSKYTPAEPKYDKGSSFGFSRIGTAAKEPKPSLTDKLKKQQGSRERTSRDSVGDSAENNQESTSEHTYEYNDFRADSNGQGIISADTVSLLHRCEIDGAALVRGH
jgi:hypothetical protein